jgi:hypothetical protein
LISVIVNQRASDSLCPVSIIVVVTLQQVREEKQPEDKKQDKKLYYNHQPQIAAYGHRPETVTIETVNPDKYIATR